MTDQQQDQPIFASSPLEQVREGMTVVDADGQELGTVSRLQMGDPQAATTAGNEPPTSGVPGVLMAPASDAGPGAFGLVLGSDPEGLGDLPGGLRQDLRRAGFVEVKGSVLEGANRFIPGDHIAEVSGDRIRLRPVSAPASAVTPTSEAPLSGSSVTAPPPAEVKERLVFTAAHQTTVHTLPKDSSTDGSFGPRMLISASATAAVLGGAGMGAWLYRRWQREQARPINRLRRATAKLGDSPRGTGAVAGITLLALFARMALAGRGQAETPAMDDVENQEAPLELPDVERTSWLFPSIDELATWGQRLTLGQSRPRAVVLGSMLAVAGAGLFMWRRVRTRDQELQQWMTPFETSKVDDQGLTYVQPTLVVPVVHDEITIERHPVDRQPADAPISDGEQQTLEIPVHTEHVTLEKAPEPPAQQEPRSR